MLRRFAFIAALLFTAPVMAQQAQPFTPEQKAALTQLVREVLVNNP